VLEAFDTDKFGTFSREVKRKKSQFETAKLKAKKGLRQAKGDLVVSSEGTFGMHPVIPMPWNVELVYLFDRLNRVEIYGVHESSETNFSHLEVQNFRMLVSFAERIGFPEHWLILRPDGLDSKYVIKDIDDYDKLEEAYFKCALKSRFGKIFVETDMRAHANPTRMGNIKKATEHLVSRILSFCPKCSSPGFAVSRSIKGLPCGLCGLPSELVLRDVYTCPKCKHEEEKSRAGATVAEPRYCHYCNP
jgi:Zn finger protein HypA/HybF involved in hydrogenase expression